MMYFQVIAGLIILISCGELLIRGSVGLAEKMGISKLVIGFTIVAFGTSAPELVICIQAVLNGSPNLAVGNVVGSNIANILLVLGLPALIYPIVCDSRSALRDSIIMVGCSILFMALAWSGMIDIWKGALLFGILIAIISRSYFRSRRSRRSRGSRGSRKEVIEKEEKTTPRNIWVNLLFILLGLSGLLLGSQLLVNGAVMIASIAGISEEIIGLTLVAFGTSLPELTTSIIASIRHHGDVAIGNILGSNLFNITGIIGITAMIEPLTAPMQILHFDLWIMIFVSLLIIPIFLLKKPIGRVIGGTFFAMYIGYVALQFLGINSIL